MKRDQRRIKRNEKRKKHLTSILNNNNERQIFTFLINSIDNMNEILRQSQKSHAEMIDYLNNM